MNQKGIDWRTVSFSIVAAGATLEIFRNIEDKNLALLASLGLAILVCADYLIRANRRHKIKWGWVTEPVWVVDWGNIGPKAFDQIPEGLSRVPIEFVPSARVRIREKEILQELVRADNPYYTDKDLSEDERLSVNVRFFRDPLSGTVNESADEYLSNLFSDIQAKRQEFFSLLRERSDPEDYESLFFEGSRMY